MIFRKALREVYLMKLGMGLQRLMNKLNKGDGEHIEYLIVINFLCSEMDKNYGITSHQSTLEA